jgi:hypothetical protein
VGTLRVALACGIALVGGQNLSAADTPRLLVHDFDGSREARPIRQAVVQMLESEHPIIDSADGSGDDSAVSVTGKITRDRRKHYILTVTIEDGGAATVDLGRSGKLTKRLSTTLHRQLEARLRELEIARKEPAASEPTSTESLLVATRQDATPAAIAPAPPPAPAAVAAAPAPTVEATAQTGAPAPAPAKPLGLATAITTTGQLQGGDQRTLMVVGSVAYAASNKMTVFGKVGWIQDHLANASSVSNVLLGATMALPLRAPIGLDVRVLTVLPVGSAGGDAADPAELQASLAGTSWGGPLFAPDHVAVSAGVKLSAHAGPVFAFVDTGLYSLTRVRGAMVDPIGPAVSFSATKGVVGANLARWTLMGGAAQTRYWGKPDFLGTNPNERDDWFALAGVAWTMASIAHGLHVSALYGRAVDKPKVTTHFQIGELAVELEF